MIFCKFEVRCTLLTIYVCKLLCNDIESSTRERVHDFIERSPKYDGNPEKMFEWCEKRMMVSCIMGAARREIIPCFATGSRI